jgi:simple sugar transport system permease protein
MKANLLAVVRALVFVAIAVGLCGVVFELVGYSSIEMFTSIIEGAFGSGRAVLGSLRWALPLFLTSAGVVICFRCGYFNIGAQGQFYAGAIGAAFVAEGLAGAPAIVVIPLTLLGGMAVGALWAAWPGYLRLRHGTDEVITTLMGNFIAHLLLIYVTAGPLKDPSGTGQVSASRAVMADYRISDAGGVSPIILAIVLATALLTWTLVNRTSYGILSSLAGRNPVMAVWQGAKLSRLGLSAFLIAGALAGLAGSIELLGPNGRIVSHFQPTHGFTAVLIAFVAGLSIVGTVLVSLFFGGLLSASLYLPVIVGLPAAAIDVINASIALLITARSWPRFSRVRRVFDRARLGSGP